MKSEELFEALTDIDEDLIFKAKSAQIKEAQTEAEYVQPVQITITKKKFPWKAACAAMTVVLAASSMAAIARNGNADPSFRQKYPSGTDIVLNSASYPDGSDYVYQGDFSELNVSGPEDGDRLSTELYYELERISDLVVCGTFTDDARQTVEPTDTGNVFDPSSNLNSYNKFRIDRLIKGDGTVTEGDEIIISQSYAIYGDTLFTRSGLTPMIKGDEWFYLLTKDEDSDSYSATRDTEGRYVPVDAAVQYINLSGESLGLYDVSYYNKDVHRIILERYFDKFDADIQNIINYIDEYDSDMWDKTENFEMAEFSGVYFTWNAYEVKAVIGENDYTLYSGMPVWDLWLADINGDGKREICSSVSFGSGIVDDRVMVFDYENGDLYELSDRMHYDYTINGIRDGVLYFEKKEYGSENTVCEPFSFTAMKKTNNSDYTQSGTQAEAEETINAEAESGYETSEVDSVNFKIYEQFGMTFEGEKKGFYYNGKQVRYFEDYFVVDEDGNYGGFDYINENGVIDVYAVRDFSDLTHNPDGSFDPSGKLIGLEEFSEEEFAARDISALLADQITYAGDADHIAYAYDDSVEIDAENSSLYGFASFYDDSVAVETTINIETAYDKPMTEEEELKAKEELLKIAEEYKPFGVTYDDKNDEWYYNGEKVRCFQDILTSNGEEPESGKFAGSLRSFANANGKVDIYTVRDFNTPNADGNGTLTDIRVKN